MVDVTSRLCVAVYKYYRDGTLAFYVLSFAGMETFIT
jgi:hypothetical protein